MFPNIKNSTGHNKNYQSLAIKIDSAREELLWKKTKKQDNEINTSISKETYTLNFSTDFHRKAITPHPIGAISFITTSDTDMERFHPKSLSMVSFQSKSRSITERQPNLPSPRDDVKHTSIAFPSLDTNSKTCAHINSGYNITIRRENALKRRDSIRQMRESQIFNDVFRREIEYKEQINRSITQCHDNEWKFIAHTLFFAQYIKIFIFITSRRNLSLNTIKLNKIKKIQSAIRRFLRKRYEIKKSKALTTVRKFISKYCTPYEESMNRLHSNIIHTCLTQYKRLNFINYIVQKFLLKCRKVQTFIRRRLEQTKSRIRMLILIFDEIETLLFQTYRKSKTNSFKTIKYRNDKYTFKCKIPPYDKTLKISKTSFDTKWELCSDFCRDLSMKRLVRYTKYIHELKARDSGREYVTMEDIEKYLSNDFHGISLKVDYIETIKNIRKSFITSIWNDHFYTVVTRLFMTHMEELQSGDDDRKIINF